MFSAEGGITAVGDMERDGCEVKVGTELSVGPSVGFVVEEGRSLGEMERVGL